MPDLQTQILLELLKHISGWIDNGTGKAHCGCGYYGKLGELHQKHVAAALYDMVVKKGDTE